MSKEQINKVSEAQEFLKEKTNNFNPETGIILGTGLSRLADKIDREYTIDYEDIPHFPLSTVESHSGKLIYGNLFGQPVVAMQGRFHYYEGYTLQQVTFPVRVLKSSGISRLLISNAAGAMNKKFRKGNLMLITDHINLLMDNPLIGPNIDKWGPRFPDMSAPYDEKMNNLFRNVAQKKNIDLFEGVYIAMQGPTLETRAEYRMLANLGGDAVGMSTVPEVIVANHMGLPCVAISVLTDECDPDNLKPVTLEEIIETAGVAEKDLVILFEDVLKALP
ncbi:purine-nucleoside phosphorylase [Salinivirga cyanobacteriivorans]|nr:purine-nucleoside phosphorylase [Salinivirga cyanobacteriivorans]